jgi:tRNA(Ile)-lysidine synthase
VHELSRSVLSYIRKQDLLRPGDRVGVAVSGGADSVALLRILLDLRAELGLVLSVVHLNHSLRGTESDDDEQFVRDLGASFDLPFFSARRDVKAYASEKKLSVETAARELRYQYFEELLRNGEFNKVATAHTLDDQAETVLLKLARGAGTRGLAGIFPQLSVKRSEEQNLSRGELTIVRPLLAVLRRDLEQYLQPAQQPWREDSTNAQLHHTRNRIRHEILPRLCAEVNPQVRRTLAEVAEIARAEEEFWQAEVQRYLSAAWSPKKQGGGILCGSLLNELPLALRRRVVRAAAESLGLSLELKHVEELLALSDKARVVLPHGWAARRIADKVYFSHGIQAAAKEYEYELLVPGQVEVPEAAITIGANIVDRKNHGPGANSLHLLDSRFAVGLLVRNWRAGDRFWPANSKRPKRVKELLQDRHITGNEKKTWPVIARGEDVLWLRAFGVRRDLQTQTGTGILITEKALNVEP